jgi:uncharacterized SAM-binding protein YcdF (DUF218 family)
MIVVAKLLGSLLYPLSAALLLLLVAALLHRRRPRLAATLGALALAWLWLWSTPWVAERAAGALERAHPPVAVAALPQADAIVLLGGLLEPLPAGAPLPGDLNGSADRAWFAARLWQAGKAPVLVCTGGLAPLSRAAGPECPAVAALLADLGVPAEAIRIESASRTTRENAQAVRALLPGAQRLLLVTSARHMPRALLAFRQLGLEPVPAPTDHAAQPGRPFAASALWPSAGALALSTAVWHEWLGRAWYRLGGG